MAKDFYWSNVVLAMHMDGGDDGTVFADVKGHSITVTGNTCTKTATKQFGTASAYFDGTEDYLTTATSSDFSFGTGDFTVEFFVKTSLSVNSTLLRISSGGASAIHIWAGASAVRAQVVNSSGGQAAEPSISWTPGGVWRHIAVTRASGVMKVFVDGVAGVGASATTDLAGGWYVTVGRYPGSGVYANLNGYIDDLRITKGVARYTSNFTPPTEPFPDSGPATVGGNILDINGNGVARTLRAYRRDTGALLGNTTSSPVTGAYSLPVDHDGEVQVVMLDDVAGTVENDQILRTTPV